MPTPRWAAVARPGACDQYAAQAGARTVTDRPEVPVEQLRCAVNRPHDAGDRDELFAGLPKLPGLAGGLPRQRKSRASTSAQHAARAGAIPFPPQPIKAEGAVHAGIPGAGRGVRTNNDPLKEKNASYHGEDSHHVGDELAVLPLWTRRAASGWVIPSRRHDRVWVHPCADSRDGQRLYPCAISAAMAELFWERAQAVQPNLDSPVRQPPERRRHPVLSRRVPLSRVRA